MKTFAGFPAGKTSFTPIPDLFFSELLAAIDDPAELKLVLYMFWALNRQRGDPRYMTLAELEAEGPLLSALSSGEADPVATLHTAVNQAVARGVLLQLAVETDAGRTDYLFMNTSKGRKVVEQVTRGELILEAVGRVREPHIVRERPHIFELYEQNIGLLQPLLAEDLHDAQETFPEEWIAEAFKIAVEHNVRNWRYIKSILERWARDGKDDGAPGEQARTGRRGGRAIQR